MLLLLELITNWIITLIFGTFIFLILCRFLHLRWKNPIIRFLLTAILGVCSNIVIYPEETTGTSGFFFTFILFLLLCFQDSLYLKISVALILFPVITAVNYMTQDFGNLIWIHIFHEQMSLPASTVLHTATLALRIPFWYLVFLFARRWIAFGARQLTPKMWLLLDMISMTSFIGIISVIYKTTSYDSYTAYPVCIACIVTSLGCCGLLAYMTKAARTEMELQAYQYQQTYYKELEQNQQTVQRLRHDMKNHLNIIGTFLRDHQLEQADSYLQELNQEFTASTKIYCRNSIINAVLNSKEQLAKDAEISYQFLIDLEETPAIENTKIHEIHTEHGVIQTSKPDPENHGIGLQNIKNIVAKYNGDLHISHSTDSFIVTVLIPL